MVFIEVPGFRPSSTPFHISIDLILNLVHCGRHFDVHKLLTNWLNLSYLIILHQRYSYFLLIE